MLAKDIVLSKLESLYLIDINNIYS